MPPAKRTPAAAPKRSYRTVFIYGVGILLLATVVAGAIQLALYPRTKLTRVMVGQHDEVYYYHKATPADASALGDALRRTGFLNDRGTTVILSKGTDGTLVSFVLNDGAWDHWETVYAFEEIGRRVAPAIGGFPIKVRLIDDHRVLHKELNVGKVESGAKDAVYYFGAATQADAAGLAQGLRSANFLSGLGADIAVSRDNNLTTIWIPLNEGAWDREDTVAGIERMLRQIAPAVGGLPLQLCLLNREREPMKTVVVR